jgi:hypothetical protein
MFLLALLACVGKPGSDDTSGGATADEHHPLAPPEYEDSWDVDSLGCDDATVYWAFDGAVDDAGNLSGQETWYWFFSTEGWDDDCADTFTLTGVEEDTPIADNSCLSCDRDFTASYVLEDANKGCTSLGGYESLLDDDNTDRIDEEEYTMALLLDTNPLGADEAGHMNVWTYVQDDRTETQWNPRNISEGTMTPDTAEDYAGAGTMKWAVDDGICVTITEE